MASFIKSQPMFSPKPNEPNIVEFPIFFSSAFIIWINYILSQNIVKFND